LLSSFQNSLRACNLHPDFAQLVVPTTGLVVLSGATGSGKSTTLSALIEEINRSSAKHILSIESPIEYLFTNRRSFIRQREVPTHTPSFEQALTDALRENPDVMVVGEMRTPEVMRLTLNAAETGHLVIATMHSANCAEALARFCMSFSAEIQPAVRAQLADTLVGMVCQRLEFQPAHGIRVPVCELLLGTAPAKGTIRAGQFSQIPSVLQTGGEAGMWSYERYQRWVAGKTDWALPASSEPLPADPQPGPVPPPVAARAARAKSAADSFEIPVEEVDLDELARHIESRGF
jgi:twitching motility protein PilT